MARERKPDPYVETAEDHPPEVLALLAGREIWEAAEAMIARLGSEAAATEAERLAEVFATPADEVDARRFHFLALEVAIVSLGFNPRSNPFRAKG